MKILKLESNQRLYTTYSGEEYRINNMPISQIINFLSHRSYTQQMTINYIKKHYNLDISEEVKRLENEGGKILALWEFSKSIYERFLKENPRDDYEPHSRDYFKNKGRNYYLKFAKWCGHLPNKDFLNTWVSMDEVHHIHPLVYGGSNDLENLIHISKFNHDILHLNPLEKYEKYNHQAICYLWYLYSDWIAEKNKWFVEKYDLMRFKDRSPSFLVDMYKASIKEEMSEFYSNLQKEMVNE